jgi:octaprenyl-diphosphate synthase
MADLASIRKPVDREMREFQGHFKEAMRTSVPLLDHITRYIVRSRGKQMRPLLVYLSAAACGGTRERTHIAATLIELLHTATLVHDDVVDAAETRRGFLSINALWKSKIAVLVGDYLLSRGLLISMEHDGIDLLRITSKAVEAMSEGELLQIEKARRLDITEEVYFEIIRRKTASLIAACCAAGAASAGADAERVELLRSFGEEMGIAFQIKDDLLDFTPSAATGKPAGGDIKERKMTLPLIHTLQSLGLMKRRSLIRRIKRSADEPREAESVMREILEGPGMAYAEEKMRLHRDRAIQLLDSLPECEAKQSLMQLVDFTISRAK